MEPGTHIPGSPVRIDLRGHWRFLDRIITRCTEGIVAGAFSHGVLPAVETAVPGFQLPFLHQFETRGGYGFWGHVERRSVLRPKGKLVTTIAGELVEIGAGEEAEAQDCLGRRAQEEIGADTPFQVTSRGHG
jgi:hypothetical protein